MLSLHLQSWLLGEGRERERDVPPLPWYSLEVNETWDFICMEAMVGNGLGATAVSGCAPLRGGWEEEDALALNCYLFQHWKTKKILMLKQ